MRELKSGLMSDSQPVEVGETLIPDLPSFLRTSVYVTCTVFTACFSLVTLNGWTISSSAHNDLRCVERPGL